jgi:carnitine O-palmitoyltransferase 2
MSSQSDYIHESIVPSDHFQKSLPRLPIPKLELTCERYLKSQAVLQSDKEHTATKKLVDEFLAGEGKGKTNTFGIINSSTFKVLKIEYPLSRC